MKHDAHWYLMDFNVLAVYPHMGLHYTFEHTPALRNVSVQERKGRQ